MTGRGEDCVVVSSSMSPKRSGDRVNTDHRDSQMLAQAKYRLKAFLLWHSGSYVNGIECLEEREMTMRMAIVISAIGCAGVAAAGAQQADFKR